MTMSSGSTLPLMPALFALISMPPVHDGKQREPQAGGHKSMSSPSQENLPQTVSEANPEALGRSRGGLTSQFHLLGEGRGGPLSVHLTAGQVHDSPQMTAVRDKVRVPRAGRGRPRKRPDSMLTDKADTGKPCRNAVRSRRIRGIIPTRSTERTARLKKGPNGGRPYLFDKEAYRQRNIVERCINRVKQFRRIATRYDKRAESYLAFITFASILIWLRS
jgi:transposase